MLTQRLGRTLTIEAIQNQEVLELNSEAMHSHGLLQDLSVASYFTLIICLFALLPFRIRFVQILQTLIMVLQGLLLLLDIHLLKVWNSRCNQLSISMFKYPQATIQSLSSQQILGIASASVALIVLALILAYLLKKLLNQPQITFKNPFCLLPIFVFMVIGARGGISKVPIGVGSAHFSNIEIENAIATNPNWNLFAIFNQPSLMIRAQSALMDASIETFAMDEYMGPDTFPGGLKRMPQIIREGSNVLIVVLEGINQHWLESSNQSDVQNKYVSGLSASVNKAEIPSKTAMPNLVKIAQDGMWYKKAYATGDRTDKGLTSIFTAWPSQPWEGLLLNPQHWKFIKQQRMPFEFAKKGYSTSFIYGGDPKFANIGAFAKHIGFNKIISPNAIEDSDWGVSDRNMVPIVIEQLKAQKKPFFSSWLTLSSHEPYDVVTEKGLSQAQMLRKSIEYTDKAVGDLIRGLKSANLYDSTVIIFVSDHGKTVGLPVTEDYEQEFFRIPLIITGGPMRDMYRGVAPYLVVSQTDIYATLTEQLLEQTGKLLFSRNMYFANHPGMALSFTEGKAVLSATGFRHHLFLDHFNQSTASDSIVLGLQSKIIRTFYPK